MDDIANKIEELTHEVDYLYQEGVLVYPSAIKTLQISIANLQAIIKDLKNDTLQTITKQVNKTPTHKWMENNIPY